MKTAVGLPYPSTTRGRFFLSSCAQDAQEEHFVEAFTDDALFEASGVRIAFTTRTGGYSEAPFDSLNLALHVQDDAAAVSSNRQLLLEAMGAQGCQLVVPNQVHQSHIVSFEPQSDIKALAAEATQAADGLLVNCCDVAALLNFADCMPVIVVAPGGAFCVLHAGWRGVYGHIVAKGIKMLCASASCEPECCNAYIGPYIHAECFEVSQDLAEKFATEFGECCRRDNRHVDLGGAMLVELLACGIDAKRIANVDMCTVCSKDEFFSYRASGGRCGRHGAFAFRLPQ